ncbi:MAG: hypothetical protein IPP71_01440 [Bacteroidetes bacterium]|nr:hypothetical protein [Bacteroidota bacterium]
MKINSQLSILLIIAMAMISCKSKNENFEALSQLEGSWSMKFDSSEILEVWKQINDTLMEGKSYEITGADSIQTETVQLLLRGNDIFYIPTVSDQNNKQPISFKLTGYEKNSFNFENPNHDFPTSIIYTFQSKDKLKAQISGKINGEMRSLDFDYLRKEK